MIFLRFIKKACNRGRNNIQIRSALDCIACLTKDTVFLLPGIDLHLIQEPRECMKPNAAAGVNPMHQRALVVSFLHCSYHPASTLMKILPASPLRHMPCHHWPKGPPLRAPNILSRPCDFYQLIWTPTMVQKGPESTVWVCLASV